MTIGLAAAALSALTAAGPAGEPGKDTSGAASRPASRPASQPDNRPAWKAAGAYRALTVSEEKELREAVKAHSPEDHQRLLDLSKTDPKQYQSLMRHMWAWYGEWKNLPHDVQEAYWTMRQTKAQTAKLLAEIQADKGGGKREALVAQLREVQAKEFDAGQVIYEQWSVEFKARIERLQAQVDGHRQRLEKMQTENQDRKKNREKHLDTKVESLLKKAPGPEAQSTASPPQK